MPEPRVEGVDYEQAVGQPVDDGNFIARLVNALESNAQANVAGPKPLAPMERSAREKAFADMEKLLASYVADDVYPRYRLSADQFQADEFIPATRVDRFGSLVATEIDFQGIPNETMHPMTEPARKVHDLYMRYIGGTTPDLADQSMEAYQNRPGRARVVGAPTTPPPLATMAPSTPRATIVDQGPDAPPLAHQRQVGSLQHTPGRL